MEITIRLSDITQKILLKRLHIKDFAEVLSREYASSDETLDFNKEEARMYTNRIRGSVRFKTGRYYSRAEYEQRVKRIKDLELP